MNEHLNDSVMTLKHFLLYWILVRGFHRPPVDSPHKGPVMRIRDVLFDFDLHKLLNKQSSDQWFDTLWSPYDIILMSNPHRGLYGKYYAVNALVFSTVRASTD